MQYKYKLKKVLLFIGYDKAETLLKLKSKEFELTDIEKYFVNIWKQKVYERDTEIYTTKIEYFNHYYVIDRKNNLILKMITDIDTAQIFIHQLSNNSTIIQTGRLGKTTMDRLIGSFNHKLAMRCEEIDQEINDMLVNNLKNLSDLPISIETTTNSKKELLLS